jgi:hypothetical protein
MSIARKYAQRIAQIYFERRREGWGCGRGDLEKLCINYINDAIKEHIVETEVPKVSLYYYDKYSYSGTETREFTNEAAKSVYESYFLKDKNIFESNTGVKFEDLIDIKFSNISKM